MRLLPAMLHVSVATCAVFGQTNATDPFVPPVNIRGTAAALTSVRGVAVDAAGNVFFVGGGVSVLRLDAGTGILTSVAGNGTPGFSGDGGPATSAQLSGPSAVAVDSAGNLYIADGQRVRKVSQGLITTVAGGGSSYPGCDNCPATSAFLNGLTSVAVDSAGNLYIFANQRVRKVTNGVITELVGFGTLYSVGPPISAPLGTSGAIAVDSAGNLYIADRAPRILKVSNGAVTTVAGGNPGFNPPFNDDNIPATSARLLQPTGIAVDAAGNLYIADNQRIRKVSNGVITTVAGGFMYSPSGGDGGPATSALVPTPEGVAVDAAGNLYIEQRLRIRKVSNGVITTAAGGGSTAVLLARSAGTFTRTGDMTRERLLHTATLLGNGKVLMAGGSVEGDFAWGVGYKNSTASAELYDSATGTFAATGNMTRSRQRHTATLLPDGTVLITGGDCAWLYWYCPPASLATAELYDPATGAFTATGNPRSLLHVRTATLLADGQVLVSGIDAQNANLAELYNPSTATFAATGSMKGSYFSATATLLPNGKVLIAGGRGSSLNSADNCPLDHGTAEIYDPASGMFSLTGDERTPSGPESTATLLANGEVLIAGGGCDFGNTSSSAPVYKSSTGTFTANGGMTAARYHHTATMLPDGTALITGGACASPGGECPGVIPNFNAEIYDPTHGAFAAAGFFITAARGWHTATLLPDGTVLISGGYGALGEAHWASSEVYRPPVLKAAPVLFSLTGDARGQGAILHAATHQVVSPGNPAVAGEVLEIYLTGLTDGSVIPPQVAIGGRMAEVLFFGKAPGFAGVNQVNVRVPSGVIPGSAVPVRLTYLARPSNEVSIGLR